MGFGLKTSAQRSSFGPGFLVAREMSSSDAIIKTALREKVRGRLTLLSPARQAGSSAALVTTLLSHIIWERAGAVLFYSPIPGEPDIRRLISEAIRSGKSAALPCFDRDSQSYSARFIRDAEADLVRGEFGILEPSPSCAPASLNRLDLVLVPGIAFDARGGRLGRGKGFYDRLLTLVSGTTCGVAFDEQLVEAVPVEPHDVRLNCILTPTRLIET